MRELRGEEAQEFLRDQLDKALAGMAEVLAQYEPVSAFNSFINTYRAIEEFINLPMFCLQDESLENDLVSLRLDRFDPNRWADVRNRLLECLDKEVVNRVVMLILQASAMFNAFAVHSAYEAAAGLQSVRHAIGYFQSRRRHLLAILYSLPSACKGTEQLVSLDTLNVLLPQAEYAGVAITRITTG